MFLLRRVRPQPPTLGRAAKAVVTAIMWNPHRGGKDPRPPHAFIEAQDAIAVKRADIVYWQTYPKDPNTWPDWLLAHVEAERAVKGSSAPSAPGTSAAPQKSPRRIERISDTHAAIYFPYDPAAVALTKTLPNARFDREGGPRWLVGIGPRDLPRVLEVAERLGLDIDPTLKSRGVTATEGMTGAATGGATDLDRVLKAAVRTRTTEGYKPYPFQLQGIEFLARHSSLSGTTRNCAILADPMGLGKTPQALLALPRGVRGIFVVPSVVLYNWAVEAKRWRPDLAVTIIEKTGARLDRLPKKGEIILVSYSRLPSITKSKATNWVATAKDEAGRALLGQIQQAQAALPPEVGYDGRHFPAKLPVWLLADEAHNLKNPKSQRAQAFNAIAASLQTVWMLTGTPIDNRPPDLWGLLQAGGCAGPVFGWGTAGWEKFKRLMGGRDKVVNREGLVITVWPPDSGLLPSPEVPELLRRVMLRREKADVLPDLPAKRYEFVTVLPATGKEWGPIAAELDRIAALLGDTEDEEGRRKLPPFEQMSRVREMLARSRIPGLMELLEPYEDAGTPVVVASAHTAPLKALEERPGWAAIHGGTSPLRRQEIVQEFQAGRLKGVGIAIQAAGVGITLTRADTMIFVDQSWKPGENAQAEDRIHRIGATSASVHYRILVSPHPLDQHVTQLLAGKARVIEAGTTATIEYIPPKPPPARASADKKAYWAEIDDAIKTVRTGRAREKLIARLQATGRFGLRGGPAGEDVGALFPPFPPHVVAAMEQAAAGLAEVCDWARTKDFCGYNAPDARTGHILAQVGLDDPVAQHTAYDILHKYQSQLGEATWEAIYGPEVREEIKRFQRRGQAAPLRRCNFR